MLPLALLVTGVVALLATGAHRRQGRVFWGDEGTYAAMAESLALDHDLVFDTRDRDRALAGTMGESPSVIVHRTGNRLYYSKPPLYPMLVAPFFLVAGRHGFWIVNVALLILVGVAGWRALPADRVRNWQLLTFVGASAVLPYVAWAMGDVLQFGLGMFAVSAVALAGKAAARSGPATNSAGRWLAGTGVCLGLLVTLRQPQVFLALGVIGAVGLSRTWRKAGIVAAATAATVAVVVVVSALTVGTWSPYTADRTSFNDVIGYPMDASDTLVSQQLDSKRASHRVSRFVGPQGRLVRCLLFRRPTHRPAGLFPDGNLPHRLGPAPAWSRGRRTAAVLGALALWLFYLWYRPDNYFGGSAAIGNRYFLPSYGVLFAVLAWAPVAVTRPGGYRGWRSAVVWSWLVAACVAISAWASVREVGIVDSSSQSHAAAGIFRLLPYESTVHETEGQRTRFWSGDYLRFVDNRTRVRAEDFVLRQEARPAEIMLATHRSGDSFRFEALGPAGSRLRVKPTVGRWRVEVNEFGNGPVAFEVPKTSIWVRHPMRFDRDSDYQIHRLLWQAETPAMEGIRIRYLGVVESE